MDLQKTLHPKWRPRETYHARAAAPRNLVLGAYVNVAVDHDRESAGELCRGSVAIFARFAVVGTAEEVREGLLEIAYVGIERLIVVPGSLDADPAALEASNERFASDVLPHVLG